MRKLDSAQNNADKQRNQQTVHRAANVKERPKKLSYLKSFINGNSTGIGVCARIVRYCGVALFGLGLATLYSILYIYKDSGVFPFYALIIAAIEIAAGFFQIKFAYSPSYKSALLIIICCLTAALGAVLALNPHIRLWPALAACAALAVSLVCQAVRKLMRN